MVNFGKSLKDWSLGPNSVTRQVNLNSTKIGRKCQRWKIQMRHFEQFLNNVLMVQSYDGHVATTKNQIWQMGKNGKVLKSSSSFCVSILRKMIAKSFAPFLLSNISTSRQMIKEWPFRNFRLPKSSPKEAKSSWTLILRKSHTSFCNEDKWGAWDFLRKMGRNQTFLMDHHSHSIITFDVDNKSSPEIWLNQLIS